MKSVLEFQKAKKEQRPISVVTAYDAWTGRAAARSNVDCILVGDSVAMVLHGYDTTVPATVDLLALHVAAVSRAAKDKFIVGDLPFLSFRKGLEPAMNAVEKLMQAGAHAVKIEGVRGHEDLIEHIVASGVPVMAHLGLTPQFVHAFGGMRVQARDAEAQKMLLEQAKIVEKLGCFAIVLECVPEGIARQVTGAVSIPTIGIGAGVGCDGQVLVMHDLLGLNPDFSPKFVRKYLDGFNLVEAALNRFDRDVKERTFPSSEETYSS